jgi:hypothetical protein
LQALSDSRVSFAAMTPAQIRRYVDGGEPMGKAGAYAVQGAAAAFIAHQRQLLWHHGSAHVRDGAIAARMRLQDLKKHAAGHPHQLVAPGNPRGRG